MENVECLDCQAQYSEDLNQCPNCGSHRKRVFFDINTGIIPGANITRMCAKNPKYKGKHVYCWEWINEDTVRGDDGITPVHRVQLIDRINDIYAKIVTDLRTGIIIRYCLEPLSRHFGHGSAKNKQ